MNTFAAALIVCASLPQGEAKTCGFVAWPEPMADQNSCEQFVEQWTKQVHKTFLVDGRLLTVSGSVCAEMPEGEPS